MKSKTLVIVTASIAAAAFGTFVMAAPAVESLRGDQALESQSPAPPKHRVEAVPGGIPRSYEGQPPMIPHDIDKYHISLRQNGCLKCHSEAAYQQEHAKRIPDSHYVDRDGNKLSHLSMRRYFCTQCHAPQETGAPLVENTFQGNM
jgi:nitrate reductase (cytochrome), electron transfer subunit